jgi:hypothetical protein
MDDMPARIFATKPRRSSKCVVSFTTQSIEYEFSYIRSDIAERLATALEELSRIDGSPANVANAETLASRVRNLARSAISEWKDANCDGGACRE